MLPARCTPSAQTAQGDIFDAAIARSGLRAPAKILGRGRHPHRRTTGRTVHRDHPGVKRKRTSLRIYTRAYTPSPMDPSMQAAQTAVVAFALFALPVTWWLIVVPTSRKKLATDKRKGLRGSGPLREYLESVDAGDNSATQWFFAKWLRQMPGRAKARARRGKAAGDAAELTGLASDATQEADGAAAGSGGAKTSAENFFSGDNPLVVVAWILGVFVAVQVALHPR